MLKLDLMVLFQKDEIASTPVDIQWGDDQVSNSLPIPVEKKPRNGLSENIKIMGQSDKM